MNVLEWVVGGLVAFTVMYIILKAIAVAQEESQRIQPVQKPTQKPTQIQVEIKSKDLYNKAENLVATHEVYAMQVTRIVTEINEVEDALATEKASCIKSDTEIRLLTDKSLRLQEQKCKIESKMLKICDELDKIAIEELRRQMVS